jgi:hypothetical protein
VGNAAGTLLELVSRTFEELEDLGRDLVWMCASLIGEPEATVGAAAERLLRERFSPPSQVLNREIEYEYTKETFKYCKCEGEGVSQCSRKTDWISTLPSRSSFKPCAFNLSLNAACWPTTWALVRALSL